MFNRSLNADFALAHAMPRLARLISSHRTIAFVVAIVLPLVSGWLVALTMPRGPVTAPQALSLMLVGLGVGFLVGFILQSRWAMALAPLVHVVAFEIGRIGVFGPTVSAIRVDNAYAILALILGRGFFAIADIAPMLLGAYFGATVMRRSEMMTARRFDKVVRWGPSVLASFALLALAALILIPASTPPILGTDGQTVPGSIAELSIVRLGGHDQTVMIRAHRKDKPVLLYLSGGPGQSDLPYARVLFDDLSKSFIVVGWDQRGAGKSYGAIEPIATLTPEQAVADTNELTDYLCRRFNKRKIYLLGESWGSILGVLAVKRRPELYFAFIGSGQMVSPRETDRRIYRDELDFAARSGDGAFANTLRAFGEPPYADVPYGNAFAMGHYEQLYKPYTPPHAYIERGTQARIGPFGVLGSEYNFIEKLNVLRGLLDTFSIMYPKLQNIDFRRDVKRLEVPVYLLDGEAEIRSRRSLALEWFGNLKAPIKRRFAFENAGHSVVFEQFQPFDKIMREIIVPETYSSAPRPPTSNRK